MIDPLVLVLEFARTDKVDDPYAFRFAPQTYSLRTSFGSYFSAEFLWNEALLSDLQAVRLPGRDPVVVQRLGETLRRFLLPLKWPLYEEQILSAVAAQREVVLTIRSAAAELYALPWELLTLSVSGQHLGELPQLLLRYEWPGAAPKPTGPAALQEGGRILFAWSGRVPAAEQLTAIETAAAAGAYPFSRKSDVLPHVSLRRLATTLEAAQKQGAPIVVLHLLCHGAVDGQSFGLLIDKDRDSDSDGDGTDLVVVDAGRLRALLAPFADMLRLVVLAACDSGNSGTLGNQLGSVAQALHRAEHAAVVASRFPLSVSGANRLSEALYQSLLVDSLSLEQSLCVARQKLLQDPQQLDWASLQFYASAAGGVDTRPLIFRPYRGLLPFELSQKRFFFGRDEEIEQVVTRLAALSEKKEPRFFIVVGAAGSGKSSLIQAGVLPRLVLARPELRFASLRPGSDPEAELQAELARWQGEAADAGTPAQNRPTLLFIEQFEQLFAEVREGHRRQAFVEKLWQLSSDPAGETWVLLALRSEYLGRCGSIALSPGRRRLDSVAADAAHCLMLTQVTKDKLAAIIEKPALLVGLKLEVGLLERLQNDAAEIPDSQPLLEDVLDLLWQNRSGSLLTAAAYDALGGLGGALESRAEKLFSSLSEPEQLILRKLLMRLVHATEDGALLTRRLVAVDKLRPEDPQRAAPFDRVLGRLLEARLLLSSEATRGRLIEVAHDTLLHKWARLREWVHTDQKMYAELERLEGWVQQWEEMQTLLADKQLAYAFTLAQRYPDDLPRGARELLRRSHRRSQQQKRRLRIGSAFMLVAICALCLNTARLWHTSQRARDAAQKARDALRVMTAGEHLQDPLQRLELLRQVEAQDPLALPGWLKLTSEMLTDTLPLERELRFGAGPKDKDEELIGVSPDCEQVATATPDAIVRVYTVGMSGPPIEKAGHRDRVNAASFSRDGRLLLTVSSDSTARVFRLDALATREEPVILRAPNSPLTLAQLSPDGQLVAATAADGNAYLFHRDGQSDGGVLPQPLSGHGGGVHTLDFSPDSSRLVTGADDGTMQVFSRTGKPVGRVPIGWKILSAVFSQDGRQILSASADQRLRIWNADDLSAPPQDLPIALGGSTERRNLLRALLSADGQRVLVLQGEAARLWSRQSATRPALLPGVHDKLLAAGFCADGQRLYTRSADGYFQIFSQSHSRLDLQLAVLPLHDTTAARFSDNSRRLVLSSADGTVEVENADGSGTPQFLTGHHAGITALAISPDSRTIATASEDSTVRLWPDDGSGSSQVLTGHQGAVSHVVFSPDGRFLASAGSDRRVLLWNRGGPMDHAVEVAAAAGPIRSIELSKDGSKLLLFSGGAAEKDNRTLAVYDTAHPGPPDVLFSGPARSASFTPDGRQVIGILQNGTLRLWAMDGQGGVKTAAIPSDAAIRQALFTPDGQKLIAGGELGLPLWNNQNQELKVAAWKADGPSGSLAAAALGFKALFMVGQQRRLIAVLDQAVWILNDKGETVNKIDTSPLGHTQATIVRPDGQAFVSIDDEGTAWRWSTDERLEKMSSALLRRLWLAGGGCFQDTAPLPKTGSRAGGSAPLLSPRACQAMQDCLRAQDAGDSFFACYARFRKLQAESYSN